MKLEYAVSQNTAIYLVNCALLILIDKYRLHTSDRSSDLFCAICRFPACKRQVLLDKTLEAINQLLSGSPHWRR